MAEQCVFYLKQLLCRHASVSLLSCDSACAGINC